MTIRRIDLMLIMLVTRRQQEATLAIATTIQLSLSSLDVGKVHLQIGLRLRILYRLPVSRRRVRYRVPVEKWLRIGGCLVVVFDFAKVEVIDAAVNVRLF